MSRTAIIAGASGLVGARCLHHLIEHGDVERVVALVRKPLAERAKLEQHVVDFLGADLVDSIPKGIDDAYCSLGTTLKKAGSREAFVAVDKTAVVNFARACRDRGARRFLLVSALGANDRSMNFYLRTKGEVERAVQQIGFDVVHVVRPSILDGERAERRTGERVGLALARVFKPVLGNYAPVDADVVARAMIKLAFSDRFGFCVHESRALGQLA